MKNFLLRICYVCALATVIQFSGCDATTPVAPVATPTPTPVATPTPAPTPVVMIKELPITLPVLDALFFADKTFAAKLKTDLQLSDDQIAQIRQTVRAETVSLRASEVSEEGGRTAAAGLRATEKLSAIVGPEKTERLAQLALERWRVASDGVSEGTGEVSGAVPLASPELTATLDPRGTPATSPSPGKASGATAVVASAPFSAPPDTRIVVNTPAYRMDVFSKGELIKSYKIAIGYPEFPLPTGIRKATSIIFNPTWVPPDEPWVEASGKVKVGQKVAAGDKLNPLGPIKIPIGLPSLIHGGKSAARIGTFASHGCVGMTNKQIQSFAQVMARLAGLELSDEDIAKYEKTPTETKSVKLNTAVPVELRYETIAVGDGKLHVYRDVYDRDTNVVENLEAVLGTYGVALSDLTEEERTRALAALELMSKGPANKPASAALSEAQKAEERRKNVIRGQLTRQFKGKKEISIEIAALTGKGYPTPMDVDTGAPPKPAPKPVAKRPAKKR